MVLKHVMLLTNKLEDPEYPLLGPTLKGLYFFGLWQTGSKFRTVTYNLVHFSTFFFVISQFIDLYVVRRDVNKVLDNVSVTAFSIICVAKCFSYVIHQRGWRELAIEMSNEELRQIVKDDPVVTKIIGKYTYYTRVVTYLYWTLVCVTNLLLITSPLLKCLSSTYREEIMSGKEAYPQILSSWFPFDNTKMPGYLVGVFVHICMGSQGSGVFAVYDMNAVAIMSYLKGQITILREKCKEIFVVNETTSRHDVLGKITECHRHHSVLVKHYKMFNVLLSPTMFFYVLICSITICCSVVQFNSSEATASQKIWIVQYSMCQVFQLFLFCWHSNEVIIATNNVDRGVYECDWWKGDVRLRRQILLLAGTLTHPFILDAGPYTTLSVATFIDIIKGAYSFYTLIVQMQNNK